jgi:hypothetical protein
MIVALAGRRVDAPGAEQRRFAPENVVVVRRRIAEVLRANSATTVVCSAACGADLLALDAARELGIPCHVVLPFARERFRESSVVDRPGPWGELFDRLVLAPEILGLDGPEDAAYLATNDAILNHASALARSTGDRILAVTVWDGVARPGQDVTLAFRQQAHLRSIPLNDVPTL